MQEVDFTVKFIDASSWQEMSWFSSGGTRAKKILLDDEGDQHYFKCSEQKPARDNKPAKHYKFEFWNEVIAYQLGVRLGLNMLRYDVAVYETEIGCLSPKMTKSDTEELLELGRFMTAINPDFLPENNQARKEYTFQLLHETLFSFRLEKYWSFVLETLLFDAMIGNTDRHQENWAFIGRSGLVANSLQAFEAEIKESGFTNVIPRFFRGLYNWIFDSKKNELNQLGKRILLSSKNIRSAAPIYDSGSSLARELTDQRVEELLADPRKFEKYYQQGKSELHWDGQKCTHLELIQRILASERSSDLKKAASFLSKWHPSIIEKILENIDKNLPTQWEEYRIPESRKKLMVKLVTSRTEELIALVGV